MLAEKKITQQDAGNALVRWVLSLDDVSRSIVLGQLRADGQEDIAELIYRRLMSKPRRKFKVAVTGGKVKQVGREKPEAAEHRP